MQTVKESFRQMGLKQQLDQNLKKAFEEACQDPNFKGLVMHLKMDGKILSHYTSALEDSAKEYGKCNNCKGLIACHNKIEGYAYLPKVTGDKLEFDYHACRYQLARLKEDEVLSYITYFGTSKDIRTSTMKEVYGNDPKRLPVMKWINQFLTSYKKDPHQKGLYLHGTFGSGKSYMISAMFHELAKLKVKSAIVFWPEFIRELKGAFGGDFKERFRQVERAPLLLIDDIGAENTTVWERDEILCTLLQYRMQEQLPTFFTSNLSKELLEQHLSTSKEQIDQVKARRIIKRIEQLTDDMELVSVNLRK